MRPRRIATLVATLVAALIAAAAARALQVVFGPRRRRPRGLTVPSDIASASTAQPVQSAHTNVDRKTLTGDSERTTAPAADKNDDNPQTKRGHLWGRIFGALGLTAVGAGFITWGATTFERYATPQIPTQSSGILNTVKIDVPVRFDDPRGQLNPEPYFTTCTVAATYGYWEYQPSLADLSAQPDEYWPQEISAVLPIANPAKIPSHLTLVLVGTAAIPNGLGAQPSLTWTRLSDHQQVDGGTVPDTANWGQPHPGDYITFKVPEPGIQFALRFENGDLVVGHEAAQIRILFRSEVRSPVAVVQGVRATVNLPLMWGVSWDSATLWGNPACGTTTATARLKGSLTNAARYRLDSGTTTSDSYEIARTVKSPQDLFYGTTIYSTLAPQLSFINRNAEASAQRNAAIATSLWIAAGLGIVPLGLQVFPWRAIRTSSGGDQPDRPKRQPSPRE